MLLSVTDDIETLKSVLNEIDYVLCVVNSSGEVIYVNSKWIEYSDPFDRELSAGDWRKINYLNIDSEENGYVGPYCDSMLEGVLEVLLGRKEHFELEYAYYNRGIKLLLRTKVRKKTIKNNRYFIIESYDITSDFLKSDNNRVVRNGVYANIANTYYLNQFFDRAISRCYKLNNPISVLLVRIDDFSQYNKALGQISGEYCYKKISFIMNDLARRPGDICASYSDDTFSIVLTDCDYDYALKQAEKARCHVEAMKINHPASKTSGYITVSVGFITFNVNEMLDKELVFSYAEKILCTTMNMGGNSISGREI